MTKRMKSEWTIRPILPDSAIRDPKLNPVVVGSIRDKRSISKVVTTLSRVQPLEKQFHFLKRVHSVSGKTLVIVSVSDDVDAVTDSLQRHVEDLSEAGLEFPLKKHEVYVDQPISRSQFDVVRSVWPCHFHEDREVESMLRRTRSDVWSDASFARHLELVERLIDKQNVVERKIKLSDKQSLVEHHVKLSNKQNGVTEDKTCDGEQSESLNTECDANQKCDSDRTESLLENRKSVALVVDPKRDAIVADVSDSRDVHPLRHAAMNAIDAVAYAQGGGAWPRDVFDLTFVDANENRYLLTGYDVYLAREPCCMCAMALVHSRAARIFFIGTKNPAAMTGAQTQGRKFGALETAVKLNAVEGLNHSYDVFCFERNL